MNNKSRVFAKVTGSLFFISLLWESVRLLSINAFGVPSFFTPSTLSILYEAPSIVSTSEFTSALYTTIYRVLFCLVCVTLVSFLSGIIIGRYEYAYSWLRPAWDFLRSIPPSSLFPVFVIIFGIGGMSKIIISIYFAVLILTLNVADAIQEVSKHRERTWKSIGIPSKNVYMYVVIPEVAAQVVSGLRVVASIIVALVVITEMFIGTSSGIGGLIINAQEGYNFREMYTAILVSGILGYAVNAGIDYVYTVLSQRYNLAF